MSSEITIINKNEEITNRHRFLHYDNTDGDLTLSTKCDALHKMVTKSIADFPGHPDQTIVKATFVWQS